MCASSGGGSGGGVCFFLIFFFQFVLEERCFHYLPGVTVRTEKLILFYFYSYAETQRSLRCLFSVSDIEF